MRRILVQFLLIGAAAGCGERPEEASSPITSQDEAAPAPEDGEKSEQQSAAAASAAEGGTDLNDDLREDGILRGRFEYVLCLRDPANSKACMAVLREKGEGTKIRGVFDLEEATLPDAGKTILASFRP